MTPREAELERLVASLRRALKDVEESNRRIADAAGWGVKCPAGITWPSWVNGRPVEPDPAVMVVSGDEPVALTGICWDGGAWRLQSRDGRHLMAIGDGTEPVTEPENMSGDGYLLGVGMRVRHYGDMVRSVTGFTCSEGSLLVALDDGSHVRARELGIMQEAEAALSGHGDRIERVQVSTGA